MKSYNNSNSAGKDMKSFSVRFGLVALLLGTGLALSTSANAATPAAGTLITNTAQATYDVGGIPQTVVNSNTVTTTVLPVGSFTLTNPQTFNVSPGQTVNLLHTVTNTGNTADTFTVTLPLALPTSLTSAEIIFDANNNGILDPGETTVLCAVGGTPSCAAGIPTGSLAPGESYNFFVREVVSASALAGSVATTNVVATAGTPAVYTTPSLTNVDTLTVSNTVFSVVKSITTANIGTWNSVAGQTITYRLAYQNTGTAAGPLYITDTIGSGATVGLLYKAGTGAWSGATTLTDTNGASDDGAGIHYAVTGTLGTAPNNINVFIENVAAGASGFVEFNVQVASPTVAAGTSETSNSASFGIPTNCTTGNCATPTVPTTTSPTNTSSFTVQAAGVFTLLKEQALGTWGGASCSAAGTYTTLDQSQKPGQCIWYRITATNGSAVTVNNVVISDTTPANTTYAGEPGGVAANACTETTTTGTTATVVAPLVGQIGTVNCSAWSIVLPNETATLEFAVRINP